ncbi:MAG: ABC transporter ATP-binding protein [Clostridium sp.]
MIEVKNLIKTYKSRNKDEETILDNISLEINEGEFVCLLGSSGCGKTTLLNLMAGFNKPTSGGVYIYGEKVLKPSIDYVTIFQDYGLLPWRNVFKNVQLGLESKKMKKDEREKIALKYLEMVGLSEYKTHYPSQLSGGQMQRVAIARAFAVDPKIIFMDEPFGALDAMTRMSIQDQVVDIYEKNKKTIVFVTHDIEEAVYLSDKIVIMDSKPGIIKKVIEIPSRKRDRNSKEFLELKNMVFKEFKSSIVKEVIKEIV